MKIYILLIVTGHYYNYDSSTNKYYNSIMADQMAGQWYLKACDLGQSPTEEVSVDKMIPLCCTVHTSYSTAQSHCRYLVLHHRDEKSTVLLVNLELLL